MTKQIEDIYTREQQRWDEEKHSSDGVVRACAHFSEALLRPSRETMLVVAAEVNKPDLILGGARALGMIVAQFALTLSAEDADHALAIVLTAIECNASGYLQAPKIAVTVERRSAGRQH